MLDRFEVSCNTYKVSNCGAGVLWACFGDSASDLATERARIPAWQIVTAQVVKALHIGSIQLHSLDAEDDLAVSRH